MCIASAYDIKELEAMRFLEKAEELVLEHMDQLDPEGNRKPSIVQDYVGSFKEGALGVQGDSDQSVATLPSISEID